MKLKDFGYAAFIAATAAAFMIGSVGTSDAKGKKKMVAAIPPPVFCPLIGNPVCGAKGGMKFTYANSCYAAKDGAKVVSDKACPAKGMKTHKKSSKKMAKPAKAKKKM